MTTLSEELLWRGFVNQSTFADNKQLDERTRTFYWGVDPSSDSMTVGNLATAMMVRHFIDQGYKAVLLVGGATGMIGDPDGKSDERALKTIEEIERNKAALVAQYKQIFAGQDFEIVDNYDWFKDMNYLTFLRDIGKHMPMSQMLAREFVQARIGEAGSGLSYAEFSYSLIQGYDFLHLYRKKGVTLQVCGSDQWGNSIAGVDLIRRIEGGEAHVWSAPLVVNKATGVKFGKSEEGAIWLDAAKTSPYRFYQFWLNFDDEGVESYLKIYTLLSQTEIANLIQEFMHNPGDRLAQKTLAYEVTKLVHGQERADSVKRVSEVLFGEGSFLELSTEDIEVLSQEIPSVEAAESLPRTLVKAGLATSNSEANRFLESGAISVNGTRLESDTANPLKAGKNLLKRGKNSFALITSNK
jgi:tyrosyl-tRNA synthetase